MKAKSILTAALLISVSFFCSQSYAQSKDIAADPQKQAGLEKNKARQAEYKKRYNSMTPAQQAEAKKRAAEYKRGGYKNQSGQGAKTSPATKPTAKPAQPGVNQAKPAQAKSTATGKQGGTKPKPILLDANGKPINNTSPAKTPAKITTPAKNPSAPAEKVILKAPAAEPVKK